MVFYKKMDYPEECGSMVWEDDLNYKNAFSFYTMENYQNFLDSYSRNHFVNCGTKIIQDDVYDILYGQLPDKRRPVENPTPKETAYSTERTLPNCYRMPAISELRQPQTEEINQNNPCLPFPMDLSSAYMQNSGFYESEDAYLCLNSAYHPSELLQTSSVPTVSVYPPAYGEPKNVQSNVFCHSTKGRFPNSTDVFYSKPIEILRENPENKFQTVPRLKPSIKGSDSLNSFKGANKDITTDNYNFLPSNSRALSVETEKCCHNDCGNPMMSGNPSPFTETAVSDSKQVGGYQRTENFEHMLTSLKNSLLPDFTETAVSDSKQVGGYQRTENFEHMLTSLKNSLLPDFTETAGSDSKQVGGYQRTENFEHMLTSLKNSLLPDFPFYNFRVKDLPLDFADVSSKAKPNLATNMSAASKNSHLNSQNLHHESSKENLHLPNKVNSDMFLTPENPFNGSKHFEHILKGESFGNSDKLTLAANKRFKTDFATIPSVSDSSKQIPTVNIAIHQIPNNYQISPSNYMNPTNTRRIPPVVKKNRINKKPTKTLTSNKSVNKIVVSIRARNAKFLCAEKDLRGRTVRELLETCEILQNKMNSKAKSDICMNVSTDVLARDPSELTVPAPEAQTDCLNNLSKNREHEGSKHAETTRLQILPEFQNQKIGIHLSTPNLMSNLTNLPQTSVSLSDSVKIYQPMIDSWKTVKVTKAKKNFFKAKHFDFTFLQIRNFKYFCNDNDEKRTSKLKLIFSKQKLVYEFQLEKTFDASGGYVKNLAMIEIKFANIVAMWGYRNELRLEVDEPPHMYVGTRYCNKAQQFGPHQNAQYDRSRTTDLTLGELYQVPFHYIRLHKVCVNKILSCLSRFNSRFEQMLQHPLIEDANKVLCPMRLIAPNMLPIRINQICSPNEKLQTNVKETVLNQIDAQPKRTSIEEHMRSYVRELRPCPQR